MQHRLVVFVFLVGVVSGHGPLARADRAHVLMKRAKRAEAQRCEDVRDRESCHSSYAAGCTNATTAGYDAYLSFLKNLAPSPGLTTSTVNTVTFHSLDDFSSLMGKTGALTKPKDQVAHASQLADAGEGNSYAMVGYVYYATAGGVETCNCQLKNPLDKDFHIGIGFDRPMAQGIADGTVKVKGTKRESTAAQKTSVIIEMTPHYRAKYHPNWTLPKVQSLVGKQVKVIGHLLLDSEHATPNQDCELPAHTKKCWRATVWELHPVVQLYVCSTDALCADNSADWIELDQYEPE